MEWFIKYNYKKVFFRITVLLLFIFGISSVQPLFAQTYTFNSSSNTVSWEVGTMLKVEVWGAGGRGGSRTSGSSNSYGGGGGGAYSSSIITVAQTSPFRVNVGQGSDNNSNPGGDSWFATNNNVNNALVLAKGGSSVPNNASAGAAGGYYADVEAKGDIRNNGGRGADGDHSSTGYGGGGGGSSAGATGTGINATNNFGAVGPSGIDGVGGNGRSMFNTSNPPQQTGNGNGFDGIAPGGGGGGARRTSSTRSGGNGANGRVIITVLGPQSTVTTPGIQEWVAPAGVTAIEVEAWGAGGRGGSRTSGGNSAYGGGGGGAYSKGLVSVIPGNTYYINIGQGATSTSAGEDSWFNATNSVPNSNNFVLAKGGNSVSNNSTSGVSGGASNSGFGNIVRYNGGRGANRASSNGGGGGGSSAGYSANGNYTNPQSTSTGATAPLGGGNGGNGRTGSGGNGNAGTAPGGGGGGANRSSGSSATGGNGANGQVIIHTFYNISITKTVTNTAPLVGANVTFTVTVTNNTASSASGVSVLDQLPNGLTHVSNSGGGSYNSTTGIWNIGELAPSATTSLTIIATVNETGSYVNTATISANLENQGNSTSSITLFPQKPTTNLQLSKEVNNTMPLIGENVVFTLFAHNAGPQNATGVEIDDILPFGFTHVSNSGGYDTTSGVWTIGALNSGTSATLTLTAMVNPTGNHYNTAVISGNEIDPDLSNNTSEVRIYPIYPLTEILLPCATTTYDLTNFNVAIPPTGSEVSWHTSAPADDSNKIAIPTNVRAGQKYYVAFYDTVDNCYGSISEVEINRSCLITNPMVRQKIKRD